MAVDAQSDIRIGVAQPSGYRGNWHALRKQAAGVGMSQRVQRGIGYAGLLHAAADSLRDNVRLEVRAIGIAENQVVILVLRAVHSAVLLLLLLLETECGDGSRAYAEPSG